MRPFGLVLLLALALAACAGPAPGQTPAPPAAEAPRAAPASPVPSALPAGARPLDEAYRGLFEACDRTDRFGGIQLPIRNASGGIRWFGCSSDPSRVTHLLRWPDGTVAWEAKLAVDLDGSHFACTTPGLTDLCGTWLMLRDASGGPVPVDSDRVPYVVIPIAGPPSDPSRPGVDVGGEFRERTGIRRGDLGVVLFGGQVVPVLVADGGPFNKIGEGSIALHRRLGRELCAARDAEGRCIRVVRPLSGIGSGVVTVVFPGSAPAGLRPDTIEAVVEREAMARWRAFSGGSR